MLRSLQTSLGSTILLKIIRKQIIINVGNLANYLVLWALHIGDRLYFLELNWVILASG